MASSRPRTWPGPTAAQNPDAHLDEYLYRAMRASEFLLKDASRSQLVSAVRTVAADDALPGTIDHPPPGRGFLPPPAPGEVAAEVTRHLSQRELEELRLVAKGLSNAEIASPLYLSNAKVKSHVARILAKLGLRDRVQVVVRAYEAGLAQPGESR